MLNGHHLLTSLKRKVLSHLSLCPVVTQFHSKPCPVHTNRLHCRSPEAHRSCVELVLFHDLCFKKSVITGLDLNILYGIKKFVILRTGTRIRHGTISRLLVILHYEHAVSTCMRTFCRYNVADLPVKPRKYQAWNYTRATEVQGLRCPWSWPWCPSKVSR